jgi:hypothetical protein
MFITLYWKTLESPLPDMTTTAVMFVITTHMAGQEPLHELAQCRLVSGLQNKVKVIRHQAEAEKFYRMARFGSTQ